MVQDHPIFGIGIGRVFRLFATYNRLVGGAPEGARFSAHNTFLNVTAEMGVVGLLAFLTLLGVAFGVAIRTLRRAANTTGAVGAGAAGHRGVIWVMVGLIAGLAAYTLTMIPGDRLILREDVATFAALLAHRRVPARRDPRAGRDCRIAARAAPDLDGARGAHRHGGRPRDGAGARDAGAARHQAGSRHVRAGRRRRRGGEQRFRWTSGHGTYYRPSSDQQLTLQVRSVAPFPQTVSIKLNDAEIDRLTLTDHAWRPLRYQLPPRVRESPYYKVELEVGPVWRPPNDPRDLGVMLTW